MMTREPPAAATAAAEPAPDEHRRTDRAASLLQHALLAAMVLVPLLLTAPGQVAADTKSYLSIDPGRLLSRAAYLWDPNVGFGTVTHQYIGYLFPMGPYYWVMDQLGVPDWVTQRLWVAAFMFAAGAGVLFLLRTLDWRATSALAGTAPDAGSAGTAGIAGMTESGGARASGLLVRVAGNGALAAATLYMLTPYLLSFVSRLSALLLPWAALPWLLGLTQRALRTARWRYAAIFALVVTLVGSVNATALVLAGIGPLLWLPFAVWVHREVRLRQAVAAAARIGILTLGCSLWWMAGLATQSGYGIDVLQYSESVETVAHTSLASEVLRGLGYWFFYGGDNLGPWIEASTGYMEQLGLLFATLAVAGLAIIAAFGIRWRYRAFFVILVVVGTAVAVGAHPYDDPSPLGALFKLFATSSTAGFALRSSARAVPLVVLGLAVLVAAGLAALARRAPRASATAALGVVLLTAVGLAPLWTGDLIGENLQRPEDLPSHWPQAAARLDDRGDGTRVLEIPGADFASYRWGNTVDPVTPGLMDRPYAARELIPYGSPPSADLLVALDRRLQDSVLDPTMLAPMARLLGVGDIVVRSDLQYERYRTPRPRWLWALLDPAPDGLGPADAFGEPVPNVAVDDLLDDEVELSIPPETPDPPPVAAFPVTDPRPIVRAAPATRPILLAGDGEGVVAAADAGLLDRDAAVLYSASLAGTPEVRDRLLDDGAELVLTDSNRRRGRRWSTVWENTGATERVGEVPLVEDLRDNRLPVFPDAGEDAFTTVEPRGVRAVSATSYGNPVTYTPENRPANAFDGDPETAWVTSDFSETSGERLVVELDQPVTTDRIELLQPFARPSNRSITELRIRADGEDLGTFTLDPSSLEAPGQTVTFDSRSFSELELEVVADNVGPRDRYDGLGPVGFAEVSVPGVAVDEVVVLPRDLLDDVGARSAEHDVAVVLERARGNAVDPGRRDEEEAIVRAFSLPTARPFTLAGEARVSAFVAGEEVDRLLGIPPAADGGMTVRGSSSLQGVLSSRPSAALDGDPETAWETPFGEQKQIGAWIDVELPTPVTFDRLDLRFAERGEHSVPTRLRLSGGGEERVVEVPPVSRDASGNPSGPVSVRFDPITAAQVRVTVEAIDPVISTEYFGRRPLVRPIGIAELGIPGVRSPRPPASIPDECRTDLLEIDGRPVGLRVGGSSADGANREALPVEVCGDGAQALTLGRGDHVLRATRGKVSGFDLDSLVLRSDATAPAAGPAPASSTTPEVEVVADGRTSMELQVRGADGPFWLVLGQSHNLGWTASVDGTSLGEPTLIDGYANGWWVDPGPARDLQVDLEWTPQRRVWIALALSALALLVCLAIALSGLVRRRPLAASEVGVGPVVPEAAWPWWPEPADTRLPNRLALATALGCGLLGALLVSLPAGAIVAAVTAAALRAGRRGRTVLAVAAVAAYGLAGAYVLAREVWKGGPLTGFEWPTYFEPAHLLAWVAVILLAADVVAELVRRRRGPAPEAPPGP